MHQVIGQRCVQDRRGVELLSGNRRANNGEDAGTNDCADAEAGQRPRPQRLLKPMFRLLRIGDQLVDGLAREELVRQGNAPGSAGISASELKQKQPGESKRKAIQHGETETSLTTEAQRHREKTEKRELPLLSESRNAHQE